MNIPFWNNNQNSSNSNPKPAHLGVVGHIRNEHSILSLCYVAKGNGLLRIPRAMRLVACLGFNFFIVAYLIAETRITSNVAVTIITVLWLMAFRMILTCFFKMLKGSWKYAFGSLIIAGDGFIIYRELEMLGQDTSKDVGIAFAISFAFSAFVVEVVQLMVMYYYCKKCCPCIAPLCIDDTDKTTVEPKKRCAIM